MCCLYTIIDLIHSGIPEFKIRNHSNKKKKTEEKKEYSLKIKKKITSRQLTCPHPLKEVTDICSVHSQHTIQKCWVGSNSSLKISRKTQLYPVIFSGHFFFSFFSFFLSISHTSPRQSAHTNLLLALHPSLSLSFSPSLFPSLLQSSFKGTVHQISASLPSKPLISIAG